MKNTGLLTILIGVCLTFHGRVLGDDEFRNDVRKGEAVLDALRSVDALYAGVLSLSGTERIGVELMRPGDPGGVFEWRYTRNADEIVLHTIRVEGGDPGYVAPGESRFADYDSEGNMIARLLIEELHHFAPDERFRLQRFRQCHVSAAGLVKKEETCDVIAFFGPEDEEPTLPIKRALWTMGRGFAPYLLEVVRCNQGESGIWEIEARGFESAASRGLWKLTIDPSRSFLVTRASYTRDGREDPTITLENLGGRGAEPCTVAGGATWSVNLGYVSERNHECAAAEFSTDEKLLEEGRNAKRAPIPATAVALDKRSGAYTSLDRPRLRHPPAQAAIVPSTRASNFLWLFVAHLAVGALVLQVYRRSARHPRADKGPGETP